MMPWTFGSHENVTFEPSNIDVIEYGDTFSVVAHVYVPFGTHEGTYTVLARAISDEGAGDTIRINVTVNPYYDIDIADNAQNVVGNVLTLNAEPGASDAGTFRVINPNSAELNVDPDQFGNADFTSLTATVTDLILNVAIPYQRVR